MGPLSIAARPTPGAPLAVVSSESFLVTPTLVAAPGLLSNKQCFGLAEQSQRARGAHHQLAVVAEAVAVDRRVGDDDLLFRSGLGIVFRTWVLVHAVHVVFALTVHREDVPAADGVDRERHGLFLVAVFVLVVVGSDGGAEDARSVELMAAELGHQAATGALPQPPANQLFKSGALVLAAVELLGQIAEAFGLNVLVLELLLKLREPLFVLLQIGPGL